MPTYNRIKLVDGKPTCPLVEEAIESFLRQTYTRSELVIINDTPGQTLLLDNPTHRIRLVNYDKRFGSLGEKCNLGLHTCYGDYVTRWDDDDISLPHRLEECVQRLDGGRISVLQVGGYWWQNEGEYNTCEGSFGFQQDLYDLRLARRVRYREISNGEDQAIRADCFSSVNHMHTAQYFPTPDKFHYIYRWSDTQSYHLSSSSKDTEARYREIGRMPIAEVHYTLKPHWRLDYTTAPLADQP